MNYAIRFTPFGTERFREWKGWRFALLAGLLTACSGPDREALLLGAWKVDSTYSYYNGFSYSQHLPGSDWATSVYDADGILREIKFGSFQSYHFAISGQDTLRIEPTSGGPPTVFRVLRLTDERMVLRKDQAPVFNGRNQERYEVRYFSRTEMPEDTGRPFVDPRQ